MAPFDRRAQRLVARKGRSRSSFEQLEAVGQALEDLRRAEHPRAHCGQLDGERQPVEPATDLDHGLAVGLGQLERAGCCCGPFDEQADGLVSAQPCHRLIRPRERHLERGHRHDMLPRRRQWLPAGGDQAQPRRSGDRFGHERRGRVQQVLAVVDDKKKLPIPQVGERQSMRLGGRLVSQVQRRRHRSANKRGVPHLGELDEPGAVAEAAPDLGGGPDGEARLSYPARPDEADQPGARELLPDLGQLPAAADEARRLDGQVADPAPGSCHGVKVLRDKFGNLTDSRRMPAS